MSNCSFNFEVLPEYNCIMITLQGLKETCFIVHVLGCQKGKKHAPQHCVLGKSIDAGARIIQPLNACQSIGLMSGDTCVVKNPIQPYYFKVRYYYFSWVN